MDKNTFWKLIEKTSAKDTDTHYINLLKEIKKLSLKDAVRFGSILSLYTESVYGKLYCMPPYKRKRFR